MAAPGGETHTDAFGRKCHEATHDGRCRDRIGMMLAAGNWAGAAEIKVISSNALKTTLEQLAPGFEKSTGHKLVFIWGAAVPLKAQIEKGAAFDLTVLTTAGVNDLVKQGKLVGATRTALANSGAAELVGPFPGEIQLTTSFATAVGTGAQQPEAAKALIEFLAAPAASAVFRAKGLDPAG
jgi:ABC-type molybdate transport system substrate-binding protein